MADISVIQTPDGNSYNIKDVTARQVMTGASASAGGVSGIVPAPSAGDEDKFLAGDGTFKSGGLPMVILSYGNSTYQNFLDAYNNNVIVYCRASSNSNPASGSQTRMAFMAYVNNAATPTEVEFQYYRSMSSHSASQMGDQVFVYKLTKTGGWTVTTREASIKEINVATGSKLGVSWSGNKVTLSNTMTADDMPMSSTDSTTTKAAIESLNNNLGSPSSASSVTGADAFSKINSLNSKIVASGLSSGSNSLTTPSGAYITFAGYVTGSGNFVDVFIPCDTSRITSVTSVKLGSYATLFTTSTAIEISGSTATEYAKTSLGIHAEFATGSTLTSDKNRVASVRTTSVTIVCA